MRFLADQDVYAVTIKFLCDLGHDVVPAEQLGMARAGDVEMLRVARELERVLVTRDRDFGALVFLQGVGMGVIYLRSLPATLNAVHAELGRVLSLYAEQDLRLSFVVVEPSRHRTRKLTPPPGGSDFPSAGPHSS